MDRNWQTTSKFKQGGLQLILGLLDKTGFWNDRGGERLGERDQP